MVVLLGSLPDEVEDVDQALRVLVLVQVDRGDHRNRVELLLQPHHRTNLGVRIARSNWVVRINSVSMSFGMFLPSKSLLGESSSYRFLFDDVVDQSAAVVDGSVEVSVEESLHAEEVALARVEELEGSLHVLLVLGILLRTGT